MNINEVENFGIWNNDKDTIFLNTHHVNTSVSYVPENRRTQRQSFWRLFYYTAAGISAVWRR